MAYPYYYPIYTGAINGKNRIWSIQIEEGFEAEQDPAPDSANLRIRKRLEWQWSNPQGGAITKGVMPSYTRLEILDPLRRVFNRFKQAKQELSTDRRYRVVITSGFYGWWGFIQLDQLTEGYNWRVQIPTLAFQVNDGISTLNKYTPQLSSDELTFAPVARAMRAIFQDELHPLPILFKNRWIPALLEADVPALARIYFSLFEYREGGGLNVELRPEQIAAITSGNLFLRVWQDLKARWRFEQMPLVGRAMGANEGCEYLPYIEPSLRTATIRDDVASVGCSSSEVAINGGYPSGAAFTESVMDAVGSVKMQYAKAFTFQSNFTRDPDFRFWSDVNTPRYWNERVGVVTRDARSLEGTYALRMDSPAAGLNTLGWYGKYVGAGQDMFQKFSVWAANENTVAGAAISSDFDFIISILPESPDDAQQYLQADGTWTDVPTVLNSGLLVGHDLGADPITYTNIFARTTEAPPVTGQWYFEIQHNSTGPVYLLLDKLQMLSVDIDGNYTSEVNAGFGWEVSYHNYDGLERIPGSEITIERGTTEYLPAINYEPETVGTTIKVYRADVAAEFDPWPAIVGVEPGESVAGYIPVDGWIQWGVPGVRYYDLGYMGANIGYLAFVPTPLSMLEGTIYLMLDPGYVPIIDGVRYIPLNLTVDGVNETTKGQWVQDVTDTGDLGDPDLAGTLITI